MRTKNTYQVVRCMYERSTNCDHKEGGARGSTASRSHSLHPPKCDIVLANEYRQCGRVNVYRFHVTRCFQVYDLVIEGARPAELDDEEVGFGLLGGAEAGGGGGAGGSASPSAGEDAAEGDHPERRELVLANETRLHPGKDYCIPVYIYIYHVFHHYVSVNMSTGACDEYRSRGALSCL